MKGRCTMAKFIRSEKYEQKLFECALFNDQRVIKDATITIEYADGNYRKLKAYCKESGTYLQFPRALRGHDGQQYIGDVVQVLRTDGVTEYYRVMPKSIRKPNSDEVVG